MKDTKYGKFTPIQHRPKLPLGENDTSKNEVDVLGMFQYHYKNLAWTTYWAMVRKTAKRCKLRLWAAHQRLQKKHPFEVPDMGDNDHHWSEDDFLLLFMWQFEAWQIKTYDMDKIYDEGDDFKYQCRVIRHQRVELINAQTTVEDAFELHDDDMRDDFVSQLWCRGHKHILEQIVDDPIFGHNAKMELRSMAFSRQMAVDDLFREAAFPENVGILQDRIRRAGPSLYNAFFPYLPNQYHNVQNCLCVMADGSPLFRLEVLDSPSCTRFKLAELMPPWWGENAPLFERPEPWAGEYDFPFHDFDLSEGDEFDFSKLMEVVERGCEQINTRHERKRR